MALVCDLARYVHSDWLYALDQHERRQRIICSLRLQFAIRGRFRPGSSWLVMDSPSLVGWLGPCRRYTRLVFARRRAASFFRTWAVQKMNRLNNASGANA